jgi:hypothetical protein
LPGHLRDAMVVRHHVVAQLRIDATAVATGHHAAAMCLHRQDRAGGGHQWRGAIAPAAQRVVDVVQHGVVRGGGSAHDAMSSSMMLYRA